MFYTIIPEKFTSCELIVSEKNQDFKDFHSEDMLQLNVGCLNENVKLKFSKDENNKTLKVSEDILKKISLPSDVPYQILIIKNTIKIGPIIGLLMFKNKSDMDEDSLNDLISYTLLYNNIGGLLYAFSAEGLNFENLTVEGFKFNNIDNKWEMGIFPFPNSIFRRTSVSYTYLKKLKECTCNKMFNSRFFSKLDYWKMVLNYDLANENIPLTKEFNSFSDAEEMLEKFSTIYLKPINGTMANGLIKISKDENSYSFFEKSSKDPLVFCSKEKAKEYIYHKKEQYNYIIQQGIDILKFDDRYVDFRVIMQKDHTLKWQCTGIITSLGKQGGMCSNYNSGAKYMKFQDFFNEYMPLKQYEIFQKKQEIISICKKACFVLDEIGENYGDLGIDVGLDKNLKPWIFELNNRRHLHSMALFIDDYDTFYRAKTNPIKYAAALSGFNVL